MRHGEYFTWSRDLQIGVVDGKLPAEELRARTLSLTYVDRVVDYDHIEWSLDNSDGLLTRPEYIACGLLVRMRLGYTDAAFPWKTFIINRVQGGVGVSGKRRPAVGDTESKVTYYGRNRNAPGGRMSRPWSHTAKVPGKRPKKAYPATSDVTKHDMVLDSLDQPRVIAAQTVYDAVKELTRRCGFEGPYAILEDKHEYLDGGELVVHAGESDGQCLQRLANARGFACFIDHQGFHWHSRTYAGAKHEVADTLIYGETPDILRLTIDADFRLPVPASIRASGYSYRMRAIQTHEADFDAAKQKANLTLAYTDWFNDPGRLKALSRTEIYPTPVDSQTKAEASTIERFITRHMRAFVIAVETVGNPKLLAGRLVDLRGTGSPLVDRILYIEEAKHNMAPSTYTTEIKLKHPPRSMTGAGDIQVAHTHEAAFDAGKQKMQMTTVFLHGWKQVLANAPTKLR